MAPVVFRSHCDPRIAEILNHQLHGVKWLPQQEKYGSRVDLVGEGAEAEYLLEIELRREDPVNNVVKVYRAIAEGPGQCPQKRIVLLHVFSGFYSSRPQKRKNAVFAGKKMAEALKNIEYEPIGWSLTPPVAGQPFPQDTDEQIHVLCYEIGTLVSRRRARP